MRTGILLLSYTTVCWAKPDKSDALFAENIYARLWRSALTGPPTVNDEHGWPHFTKGGYNNTPQEDGVFPGTYVKTGASGWTSGFFPDALWQAYRRRVTLEPRDDFPDEPSPEEWLDMAQAWTDPLQTNINLTNTHDLGFLAKPFESAMQIQNNDAYLPVLQNMSLNLAARFEPGAGIIRSWDCAENSVSQHCSRSDSVLVIIDNMMNLALLARSASTYTHNATLLEIAISHADKTMAHHVRPDGSSFHVCDYSATTGDVYLCRTAQGLADDSTWARGQAWGIYGFAEFYSLTGNPAYLQTAQQMADWFLDHLPSDGLPFWDFDAEFLPNVTPRDSSAASIAASGMILLQQQLEKSTTRKSKSKLQRGSSPHRKKQQRNYKSAAADLLKASIDLALAGEISFADSPVLGAETAVDAPANTGVSKGFESILMHATSNNNPMADPRNFDSGLSYGDFYFLEAGNRLLELDC
ncbi:hypothetical protein Q7P37_008311 [Cladosporium fusiforme]